MYVYQPLIKIFATKAARLADRVVTKEKRRPSSKILTTIDRFSKAIRDYIHTNYHENIGRLYKDSRTKAVKSSVFIDNRVKLVLV